MTTSLRLTVCFTFVIATCVSCSNDPTGATYSPEHLALLKNQALIVVTDVDDNPIHCLFYAPNASDTKELVRLEVHTSETYQELGFYVLGDQVNDQLDCSWKFIKSHESSSKRGATFDIQNGEILNFSGNGFATSTLNSSHLDYALDYNQQDRSVPSLQVVKYYLLETIEHGNMLERIVCSHNETTNEFILLSETHIYGLAGMGTSTIEWATADDRWVEWKKDFLEGVITD